MDLLIVYKRTYEKERMRANLNSSELLFFLFTCERPRLPRNPYAGIAQGPHGYLPTLYSNIIRYQIAPSTIPDNAVIKDLQEVEDMGRVQLNRAISR